MRNSKLRLAILAIPAALAMPIALPSGIAALGGQETMSAEKAGLIENIQSMPRTKVNSIQPEGTPIQIQTAAAREIQKGAFRRLTGEAARHQSMSTYPEVTLANISRKTITSFMIVVKSRVESTSSGHFVLTKDLSIAPGASYSLASSKWTMAEKRFVQKNGKFVSGLRQPGIDSAKSWLPGAASDLTVVVAMVVFEDGSQWQLPSDFAL